MQGSTQQMDVANAASYPVLQSKGCKVSVSVPPAHMKAGKPGKD